jgi:hypothetical protein
LQLANLCKTYHALLKLKLRSMLPKHAQQLSIDSFDLLSCFFCVCTTWTRIDGTKLEKHAPLLPSSYSLLSKQGQTTAVFEPSAKQKDASSVLMMMLIPKACCIVKREIEKKGHKKVC